MAALSHWSDDNVPRLNAKLKASNPLNAKEDYEHQLDISIRQFGPDHIAVASCYNNLGVVHQQLFDLQRAKECHERALEIRIKLLGHDHTDVAHSYYELGVVHQNLGDLQQAKESHEHALSIRLKLLRTDNMYVSDLEYVSDSYNSLSSVNRHLGDREKANQLYESAQAIRIKKLEEHADDQPDDILYNNAYHRALNAGQANNTRIPIMIVGQDRAGKTSLKKHLLGLPFDSQEPSTNGIDVDVVELTDRNAEDPWKRKEVKQFMRSEEETKKQIFKQAAQFSSEVPKEPNTSNQAQDVNTPVAEALLSRAEIDDIKSLETDTSDDLPPIRVFVHDLAGQDIYHDTHYYFLRFRCPCVVVHDLRKPFGNPAQPRFKPSRVDVESNLNNPLLATNMDYFLSWLDVLDRLKDSASDVGSNESLKFKLPPVLIVLTNSDRFEGNIDEVKNRIKDILDEKGFENVFTEFYIVDNSSSGEGKDEARKLRGMLYRLCKDILGVQPQVPIRWLQFESKLSNKMMAEQLTYIPVEVAREIAESCDVENVDAAIRFLHHQGVIVHHVGSPVVVLNPQWLMNVFAEIITVPQEDKPCDALHRKLMKEGILMQEYLQKKGHGKVLEMLMVQFGLICPWEHKGKPAFIVPSVAPLMQKGKDVQKELSTSPIACVFFKFQCGYVLPGLFTRFLVGMINKCREFLDIQRPRLFCNYALLLFEHSEAKFDVYIIKQLAGIKIGVVPRATVSQHCCVMFARYLKASMIYCIKNIKDAERLFYWSIDASLKVKCSVCFGENQPCIRHAKDKCEHDDCGHFWSLDELQRTTKNPICTHGSIVRRQEFPLEDAKHWISVDNLKTFSRTECCSLTNAGENEPSCSSSLTQADQPTDLPVLELSISNLQLLPRQEICKLLDVKHPVGGDFRELAGHFEMSSNDLDLVTQEPNPTHAVLNWAAQDCGNTIGKLREILSSMGRNDCVKIIDDCSKSGGTSTSS